MPEKVRIFFFLLQTLLKLCNVRRAMIGHAGVTIGVNREGSVRAVRARRESRIFYRMEAAEHFASERRSSPRRNCRESFKNRGGMHAEYRRRPSGHSGSLSRNRN